MSRGRAPGASFHTRQRNDSGRPDPRPAGKHILWAYTHVPNGSNFDMTERIEAQIERFAPGFRDRILARCVMRGRGRRHNANSLGRHQRRASNPPAVRAPDQPQPYRTPLEGSISAHPPHRRAAACTACAATTRADCIKRLLRRQASESREGVMVSLSLAVKIVFVVSRPSSNKRE